MCVWGGGGGVRWVHTDNQHCQFIDHLEPSLQNLSHAPAYIAVYGRIHEYGATYIIRGSYIIVATYIGPTPKPA